MDFILMNQDIEVARFQIGTGVLGETFSEIEILCENCLPLGFKSIESWIANRKASKHNHYLQQLMEQCGCRTAEGFIQVTHAASINDTFWIRGEQEAVRWEQVSLYQNEYDEVISKLAFEGVGLYGIQLSGTSPELSTEGSFRKCWKRENDGIYLYKAGSEGARNTGLEPYCEVLASELAERICASSVGYQLAQIHGQLASKCLLFTNESYGFVPYSRLDQAVSADGMLQFYTMIGAEDAFRRMLVLDSLTFNIDRHTGNHGVFVNNRTQHIMGMAPVFDLNLAMFPYLEQEDFAHIGTKMLEYAPGIGVDFTEVGQAALTPEIRRDLVSLKGYEFLFRGDDRFTEDRIKKLEVIVNTQIEALLSKEKLRTKEIFVPDIRKNE